jgi:hypothetical protein
MNKFISIMDSFLVGNCLIWYLCRSILDHSLLFRFSAIIYPLTQFLWCCARKIKWACLTLAKEREIDEFLSNYFSGYFCKFACI